MDEFLNVFNASLRHMRADEKQDILQDFREHFEVGLSSGKTEREIADELGDPRQLARMYSAESAAHRASETKGFADTLRMLGAVISYKIGGGLFIFTLYLFSLTITLSLFASAIALIAGGIGCAVFIVFELARGFWMYALLALFGALALICGGSILWIDTAKLCKVTVLRLPLLARRITRIDKLEGERLI
jgi:uncharacterized membrane protein